MGEFFKGWRSKVGVATLVMALVLIGGWGVIEFVKWRHAVNYPYGWSHCCIKQFMLALENYAVFYDGHYPTGKECPEASLSLLYYAGAGPDANAMRGKTVPEEIVQAIFDQEGFLGPDTCGWHYVDGLTQNDDSRLAILWDKAGLGHNGERNPTGGREVIFVGGHEERIPHEKWPKFLQEQELLMASRDEFAVKGGPFLVGQIKMPNGELLDHFEGRYELEKTISGIDGVRKGIESGELVRLKWMKQDIQMDGERTLVLVLPDLGLRSKPVTFMVKNLRPTPSRIVFEMEETQ
jgi:hypothetical protein